jgi:NADH-quinone oxidoreductase subunit A
MQDYIPVFIQVLVALGFAAVSLGASVLLGKVGKRNAAKDSAYECGKVAEGATNPRFSVKFHLVAMLFILFDIEVVFMYTWAVVYREQLATGALVGPGIPTIFLGMFTFVGILLAGYIYAVKKKAFDWKSA